MSRIVSAIASLAGSLTSKWTWSSTPLIARGSPEKAADDAAEISVNARASLGTQKWATFLGAKDNVENEAGVAMRHGKRALGDLKAIRSSPPE